MNDYAAILGTLAGVLAGGLVNFFATGRVKQQEWRLSLARDQIIRREGLYADYLAEAQRLTAKAIYQALEVPKDIHDLDRMLAQMTLLSPSAVAESARELRRHLLRKRSTASEMLEDRPAFDQLSSSFIEAARNDLLTYRNDA